MEFAEGGARDVSSVSEGELGVAIRAEGIEGHSEAGEMGKLKRLRLNARGNENT